jgi:hypothetical protein
MSLNKRSWTFGFLVPESPREGLSWAVKNHSRLQRELGFPNQFEEKEAWSSVEFMHSSV